MLSFPFSPSPSPPPLLPIALTSPTTPLLPVSIPSFLFFSTFSSPLPLLPVLHYAHFPLLYLLPLSQVIPLESQMKRPQRMPFLLDMACLVVVGVNLPFAVYGYLLFGSNTQGMWVGVSECVGACVCVIGYFLSLPHSALAILRFPPFPRLPSSLPSFPSFLPLFRLCL